jgi:hypothetical protein
VEIAVERLLGTKVQDVDGHHVGRVEEVHAQPDDGQLRVTEYVLGTAGLIERLSLGPILRALLGPRFYPEAARYTIGWADLDLTDPERPRLKRRIGDLEAWRPG